MIVSQMSNGQLIERFTGQTAILMSDDTDLITIGNHHRKIGERVDCLRREIRRRMGRPENTHYDILLDNMVREITAISDPSSKKPCKRQSKRYIKIRKHILDIMARTAVINDRRKAERERRNSIATALQS